MSKKKTEIKQDSAVDSKKTTEIENPTENSEKVEISEKKKALKSEKSKKVKTPKEKIPKRKRVTTTSIGGQAVLEGVMMRGRTSMATAVRDSEGKIRIESKRLTPPEKKPWIVRVPIIRGVVNFFDSLVNGTKILMRSAEVYGEDDSEPSKFEKWVSTKLHINIMSVVTTISVIIGLLLSIGLFVVLPQLAATGLDKLFHMGETSFLYNLIEGLIRILIFVCYILLTSLAKDIKRVYMYHGAEHKTITCFESGLELTPENAKKCRRVHDRCGTTFLFFVMLVSILVFSIANSILGVTGIWRILLKIALLPLVAGLSYELLKGLAKTQCWIFWPLKAPGLLLQKITTREPDLDMLEVAIASFKTVLEMDADESIKEQTFVTAKKLPVLLDETKKALKKAGINDDADAEWIVSIASGLKRSEIADNGAIEPPSVVEKVEKWTRERATGKPLWQVIGNCDFYGYKINVTKDVLTPRPETEELCAWALESIKKEDKVLDLCTGSGACAVVIKAKSDADVTASDISGDALEVALKNAKENNVDINFVESNLFENIQEKFNVIVSNPPYIPADDIENLDREVKDFEPRIALDGGKDGLYFYRKISRESREYLLDGGFIYFEVGINQAEDVKNILLGDGYEDVEIKKDLEGVERMLRAKKTA